MSACRVAEVELTTQEGSQSCAVDVPLPLAAYATGPTSPLTLPRLFFLIFVAKNPSYYLVFNSSPVDV